ncbi:CLUMA_CG012225, isoform A [Clunio marinus]|uniref:CLUMA_CG012225, isoform A n=1 Tax=Clunio marinus TaxID=568069 RepID=A0A1J1IKN6_9DIPT|nr:CLUMA_CG012225, isoform A [Clunio marinus]
MTSALRFHVFLISYLIVVIETREFIRKISIAIDNIIQHVS